MPRLGPRLAALLLAALPFPALAGADAPSTAALSVELGGRVVANTLRPSDPAQTLHVHTTAAWYDDDLSRFLRIGFLIACEGAYPALAPSITFTFSRMAAGESRAVLIRAADGEDRQVLPLQRGTDAPGPPLPHIRTIIGAERVLEVSRLLLRTGALVRDGGSRYIVTSAPERLQGALALVERCIARHLPPSAWYAPPGDLSRHLRTSPEALRDAASRARAHALSACAGPGASPPLPLLLALQNDAVLLASPPPRWEWLVQRHWYLRLARGCEAR